MEGSIYREFGCEVDEKSLKNGTGSVEKLLFSKKRGFFSVTIAVKNETNYWTW